MAEIPGILAGISARIHRQEEVGGGGRGRSLFDWSSVAFFNKESNKLNRIKERRNMANK